VKTEKNKRMLQRITNSAARVSDEFTTLKNCWICVMAFELSAVDIAIDEWRASLRVGKALEHLSNYCDNMLIK